MLYFCIFFIMDIHAPDTLSCIISICFNSGLSEGFIWGTIDFPPSKHSGVLNGNYGLHGVIKSLEMGIY